MFSSISSSLSTVGSYADPRNYALATPKQMLGNLCTVGKLALPIIALVATQQAVEAGPTLCMSCWIACLAATGGAFSATCAGICAMPCAAPTL